jgi:hypothetical protein
MRGSAGMTVLSITVPGGPAPGPAGARRARTSAGSSGAINACASLRLPRLTGRPQTSRCTRGSREAAPSPRSVVTTGFSRPKRNRPRCSPCCKRRAGSRHVAATSPGCAATASASTVRNRSSSRHRPKSASRISGEGAAAAAVSFCIRKSPPTKRPSGDKSSAAPACAASARKAVFRPNTTGGTPVPRSGKVHQSTDVGITSSPQPNSGHRCAKPRASERFGGETSGRSSWGLRIRSVSRLQRWSGWLARRFWASSRRTRDRSARRPRPASRFSFRFR